MPPEYPAVPPQVEFKTKIFHPNFDEIGRVNVSILREDVWNS